MRKKLIAAEVLLLVFSVGFYVWSIQEPKNRTDTGVSENQPVFANLKVSDVKTIELQGGGENLVLQKLSDQEETTQSRGEASNQEQSSPVEATMSTGPYRANFDPKWVISSFHNYGVKEDRVQNRILKPLRKLERGTVAAREKANLKEFGLDEASRRRLVLKDASNNVIREVVLGKRITGFTDARPSRFGSGGSGDQESIYYYDATNPEGFEVRLGRSEFSELPLDPQEWVNKSLLSYEEDAVSLIAMKHKEKLFLLRRNDAETSESSEGGQGDGSGESTESSGQDENEASDSEPEWTLYSGDYYADGLIPLNAAVVWRNQKLQWRRGRNQIQSVSLTKRKLKENKAESLARTLSSLSADTVVPPISLPANQKVIPQVKKEKYGFHNPETVLYLGEQRKQGQLQVYRARFFVGKPADDETVYFSSLKTGNTVQQAIRTIMGLGAQGGNQAQKLIPVYTLSSMDRGDIVSPGDLVKKEEDKENGSDTSGTEGDSAGSGGSSNSESGSSTNQEETGDETDASTETDPDSSSSSESSNSEDSNGNSTSGSQQ